MKNRDEKNHHLNLLLSLALVAAVVVLMSAEDQEPPAASAEAEIAEAVVGENEVRPAAFSKKTASSVQKPVKQEGPASSLTWEERKSLSTLLTVFAEASRGGMSPKQLVSALARAGLKPVVMKDTNETGTMIIIRTKNALPGTRYVHAQYFDDYEKGATPQHLSFEVRPGATFKAVTAELENAFGRLGKPTSVEDGIVSWDHLPNGCSLWEKSLTGDDLANDPFNAYSSRDVGTTRIALECDLHAHDHVH